MSASTDPTRSRASPSATVTQSPTSVADMYNMTYRGDNDIDNDCKRSSDSINISNINSADTNDTVNEERNSNNVACAARPPMRNTGYFSSDDSQSTSINYSYADSENLLPLSRTVAKGSPPPKVVKIPFQSSRNILQRPPSSPTPLPPPPPLMVSSKSSPHSGILSQRQRSIPPRMLYGRSAEGSTVSEISLSSSLDVQVGDQFDDCDANCTSSGPESSTESCQSPREQQYFYNNVVVPLPSVLQDDDDNDAESNFGSLDYSADDDLEALARAIGSNWGDLYHDNPDADDDSLCSQLSGHRHQCFEFPLVRSIVRIFRPNAKALKQQRRSRQGRWLEL